jgi:hypothetical protein
MNPIDNPYQPGAGTQPPELAGRTEVLERTLITLKRLAKGKAVQPPILVGLRGVGKTVLLVRMQSMAKDEGFQVIYVEATEGKSLPELLVPGLRSALLALSVVEAAKEKAKRGLGILKGFVAGFGISFGGMELSYDPTVGVADSGDLEADLPELLIEVGEAAAAACRCVVLFVDELQVLERRELSALISAVHKINQQTLPIAFIGAGLPQVLALAGNAKAYSERLFVFSPIGELSEEDATAAITHPAEAMDVEFEPDAISEILRVTQRYPYFLQQWAHDAWNIARDEKTITWSDVLDATETSRKTLDESFFRVRYDQCSPNEKLYMRALAELGQGKQRSSEVADQLGCETDRVSQSRSSLVRKGMIYAPSHGDVCFTVPLFDEFMRREIPEFVAKP